MIQPVELGPAAPGPCACGKAAVPFTSPPCCLEGHCLGNRSYQEMFEWGLAVAVRSAHALAQLEGVVVAAPLTPERAEAIRDDWERRFTGPDVPIGGMPPEIVDGGEA